MLSGQDGSPNSRGIIQKKIDLKKDADWRLFLCLRRRKIPLNTPDAGKFPPKEFPDKLSPSCQESGVFVGKLTTKNKCNPDIKRVSPDCFAAAARIP